MAHTTTAPSEPISTTIRQPSRPPIRVGTSRYDRMATIGAAVNMIVWLKAIARPRIEDGTSSVT